MLGKGKTRIEDKIPVEELYQLAVREGNSKKPIYRIHKWWARRLGSIFRMLLLLATAREDQSDEELWRRFYQGDNLSGFRLLDPFMGGGVAVVEGTKLRMQTAGVDIDPIAWFVTRQEVQECSIEELESALEQLEKSEVAQELRSLYHTNVLNVETSEVETADIIYSFWVDVVTCPQCQLEFEAHKHYQLRYSHKNNVQEVFCQHCHKPHTISLDETELLCSSCQVLTNVTAGCVNRGRFTCPGCRYKGRLVDLASTSGPFPKKWFAIEYMVPRSRERAFKRPDETDLANYALAEKKLDEAWDTLPIPLRQIPLEGREDLRPVSYGYRYYHQLFNARQLYALGLLLRWICQEVEDERIRDFFTVAFSDCLACNNLLCSFAYGYDKLTPLFGLHAYSVPTQPVENNVWGTSFGRGSFRKCFQKVIAAKKHCHQPYESRYGDDGNLEKVYTDAPIVAQLANNANEWYGPDQEDCYPSCLLLNQSSEALPQIQPNSVDIVLSDPPYYDNLSYSELSDFYYAWIKETLVERGARWDDSAAPYEEALFVSRRNSNSDGTIAFTNGLKAAFKECYRVLKDEGLFIFTFHHLDVDAWLPLAEALLSAKFKIVNVFPLRSEGTSAYHSSAGTVKWDAVLVCRKFNEEETVPQSEPTAACLQFWEQAEAWQKRLREQDILFRWPDMVSLALALCLQYITVRDASSLKEAHALYNCLKAHIVSVLPDSGLNILLARQNWKAIPRL